MRATKTWLFVCVAIAAQGCGSGAVPKCETESTFAQIQAQIFDARGCTNAACHGQSADLASGGLDLRPANAFASLVNVDGLSGDFARVFPGDEDLSLLYLKVAAKPEGSEIDLSSLGITGGPMPASGNSLTDDDLGLLRQWIRAGAPEIGVVAGSEAFAGCDFEAGSSPNKIAPLPPPDPSEGVQFYAGAWSLPADSENELCFVSYYDYSDRVPAELKVPCTDQYGGAERECVAFNHVLLAQDPQSHHSIVEFYVPPAEKPEQWDPASRDWKSWQCNGGVNDLVPCTPGGDECGERSQCVTAPRTTIGCTLYTNGPFELASAGGFFGQEASRVNIATAQEFVFREDFVPGVFSLMPVKGFVVWNSHAFNLTDQATTIEQWLNLEFSASEERLFARRQIFDASEIFGMGVIPPFESSEVCNTFTLPQYAKVLTLSSHMHQRGKLFRIWDPPNAPCSPGPGCQPPTDRDPVYVNRLYDDPLYQRFEDPENLPTFDSAVAADRTYKFCALYDNGDADPSTVKRNSVRPDTETCEFLELAHNLIPGADDFLPSICGCKAEQRACVGGRNQGALCEGDDSACGSGVCDACPLTGGVTTEDEMFLMLGSYFVDEP